MNDIAEAKANASMDHLSERSGWYAVRRTFSWPVVSRSFLVALIVGTILNAINQGSEIAAGKSINMLKLLLTYAVPFFVASYGAYSAFSRLNVRNE